MTNQNLIREKLGELSWFSMFRAEGYNFQQNKNDKIYKKEV